MKKVNKNTTTKIPLNSFKITPYLKGAKRLPDETYEDYKKRRYFENELVKMYKKGDYYVREPHGKG